MTKEKQVAKTAGFLMIIMVLSRILGYLRDIIIYSYFGQNRITDAYNAAFSIPDFLYMLLVGGALSSAFIPVFSGYIARKEEEEAWEVASILFNFILLLLMIGVGIGYLLAPQLVALIVPGFEPEYMELTIRMTRIMFLQVIFMSMAGMAQGILHSFKHFKMPALGSLLYNVAIILVGALLVRKLGIIGFSIGVVAGSLVNLLVQIPVLKKKGVRYIRSLNLSHPGVKKILALIVPILLGQSVIYLNLFVTQNLASGLDGGMIAALKLAERLMKLPIAVVGISMAVALFPNLTEYVAIGNMKRYHSSLTKTLNNVIFLALPSAVGLAIMGKPLIRMMYQQGAFDAAATKATTIALVFYSAGILAYSAIHVLSRAFYALEDTKTPVIISSFSMLVNLGFSLLLIGPMGHGGLALAYSMTGTLHMCVMLLFLRRKSGPLGGRVMLKTLKNTAIASAGMALVIWTSNSILETWLDISNKSSQALVAVVGVTAGFMVFMLLARLLKMEEEIQVRQIVTNRFKRNK
ncbi:murein biosynthesis integral membrane protein MurJ [Clostridia bacterium]|nr:murein biosynthesis integral membrane protein MurJ [Clostridia bacterium]